MRKPSTIRNSNKQDINKTLEDTFLISYKKRPVRFLVALNTLDKFLGCHAHVEDVTTRFGSVLCLLQISDMNVLYRLKKTLHMRYIGPAYSLRYLTFVSA